jgi:hypothetical protein
VVTLTDAAGNRRALPPTTVAVTVPGTFKLDRTAVWHGETVKLAASAVPAGTTKITVSWGDGYVSTPRDANWTAGHRYHHRAQGGLVPGGAVRPSVVLTNGNGDTMPIAVGTVNVRKDSWNPKATVTTPRRPERVSSWRTVRGTASDRGSGVAGVRVVPKLAVGGTVRCYTSQGTWLRVTGNDTSRCGVDVKVAKGAWSLALPGLTTGTLQPEADPGLTPPAQVRTRTRLLGTISRKVREPRSNL